MSSIHQDKWFMWLDTNCNLPENFKGTTICNSPLENSVLFYADTSLKRTLRVPPSIYAKPDSGIWKRSACGIQNSGPARGVVVYQYTRYFAPKIPIYLNIVKCVILNT